MSARAQVDTSAERCFGNREIQCAGSYILPGSFILVEKVLVYVEMSSWQANMNQQLFFARVSSVLVHQFADKCR